MRKGSGLRSENFENMPSVIVPKPPKPGFVSFGAITVGCFPVLKVPAIPDEVDAGDVVVGVVVDSLASGTSSCGVVCKL